MAPPESTACGDNRPRLSGGPVVSGRGVLAIRLCWLALWSHPILSFGLCGKRFFTAPLSRATASRQTHEFDL